jgi:putative SOS response-associated peptidase YedK
MCGRYILSADAQVVQQTFKLDSLPPLAPRYNIAPSQPVPIITNDKPTELTIVQWGLIPSWSKDPKIGYKMINARSESIHEKPSFRTPFKYRRCLIPGSGFYEWVKADDGKQPYLIHLPEKEVFAFAGLWEIWHSSEGEEVWTCTILTTEANDTIRHLHHRMPVILDENSHSIWLDKDSEPDELKTLFTPYDSNKTKYFPVSKAVNSPQNDNPSLIERDEPPQQQGLF